MSYVSLNDVFLYLGGVYYDLLGRQDYFWIWYSSYVLSLGMGIYFNPLLPFIFLMIVFFDEGRLDDRL